MKASLIDYICCPNCGGDVFTVEVYAQQDVEIETAEVFGAEGLQLLHDEVEIDRYALALTPSSILLLKATLTAAS